MNEERLFQAIALQAIEDAQGVWRNADGEYVDLNSFPIQLDAMVYLFDENFGEVLDLANIDKTQREIRGVVRDGSS